MQNIDFTVQELLQDPTFVQWVLAPDDTLNSDWNTWAAASNARKKTAGEARQLIMAMQFGKHTTHAPDPKLWSRIQHTLQTERRVQQSFLSKYRYTMRVAASLVLLVLFGLLLYHRYTPTPQPQVAVREIIEKQNPNGIKTQLRLPDGTKVWLNSGSKLTYPSHFANDSRNVELVGEAFFDVVENKNKPFVVHTPYFTTTVLGTSFSVQATENTLPRVSLVEGKVKVSKLGHDKIINPGQQVVLDEGKMVLRKFSYAEEVGWKDGILFFKDNNHQEVFEKLERWYGVNIQYDKEIKLSSRYSGQHQNQTLKTVLKGIGYSLNFDYQISEDKQVKIMFH